MLTPPDISQETLRTCAASAYGLRVLRCEFLPMGADVRAAAFRIEAADGASYFLKLRQGGFNETSVSVPAFLRHRLGMNFVVAPLPTRSGRLWEQVHGFHWILYPFVEGTDGFRRPLSETQWKKLGEALGALHRVSLPAELAQRLPTETYSPIHRDAVRDFRTPQHPEPSGDAILGRFLEFWRSRRRELSEIADRAEQLGRALAEQRQNFVLCHGDIHAGNVLAGPEEALSLVDWDTLILAPRERDLMFMGGAVGGAWNDPEETMLFYRGYGGTGAAPEALAYYRYERLLADLAETWALLTDAGTSGENREEGLQMLLQHFHPGNLAEAAHRSYREIP